jgi:carbon monoxide dehydrogenase subunit G
MKIETPHEVVAANDQEIFAFLTDMNNFEELFPKEKIENWQATNETCSFKIKGMADIGLKRVASTPNSLIYLDSFGKLPFKFTLNIYLSPTADNQTEAFFVFEGDINPFMKMMLEKPLTSFFNSVIRKLKEKYN